MKTLITLTLLILSACGHADMDICKDPTRKRILTIGDSITLGWTPYAALKTNTTYEWLRINMNESSTWPDNARNTNYTLRNVYTWIDRNKNLDIIIWNNGVWNCTQLGYTPPSEDSHNYGTDAAQYENELQQIAVILKTYAKRVIFNTTTDCKNGEPSHNHTVFNEIAKRVLPQYGVEIWDLDELTRPHPEWWVSHTDVHFGTFGNEYISEWIANVVLPNKR